MDTPVDLVFGKRNEQCFITHSFLHLFTFSNRCSKLEPHGLLLSPILNPEIPSLCQNVSYRPHECDCGHIVRCSINEANLRNFIMAEQKTAPYCHSDRAEQALE